MLLFGRAFWTSSSHTQSAAQQRSPSSISRASAAKQLPIRTLSRTNMLRVLLRSTARCTTHYSHLQHQQQRLALSAGRLIHSQQPMRCERERSMVHDMRRPTCAFIELSSNEATTSLC